MKKLLVMWMAVGLGFLQASVSVAVGSHKQDHKIWNSYIDSRRELEKQTHELVSKKWIDEKTISKIHLDLELARLDKKDAQFDFLIEHHPERIDRKKGLDDFANLEWSSKDEENLAHNDKKYAQKISEINQLERKYEALDGRSTFESNLSDVKNTVEYRSIQDRFHDMVSKLDASWQELKQDIKK